MQNGRACATRIQLDESALVKDLMKKLPFLNPTTSSWPDKKGLEVLDSNFYFGDVQMSNDLVNPAWWYWSHLLLEGRGQNSWNSLKVVSQLIRSLYAGITVNGKTSCNMRRALAILEQFQLKMLGFDKLCHLPSHVNSFTNQAMKNLNQLSWTTLLFAVEKIGWMKWLDAIQMVKVQKPLVANKELRRFGIQLSKHSLIWRRTLVLRSNQKLYYCGHWVW